MPVDVRSEPSYREELVTDLDCGFPSGVHPVTVHADDRLEETPDAFIVHQAEGGVLTLYKARMDWYGVVQRTIRWPLAKPSDGAAPTPPV